MNATKKRRIENGIQNANPMRRNMNISDVNFDCLEEIFEWLGPNDLLNVADTCKRFRRVAAIVFDQKYETKYVSIDKEETKLGRGNDEITGFVASLQLLRCFGHLITQIDIHFDDINSETHCFEIFRYLNEYCSQTLRNFCVYGSQEVTIDDIIYKQFPQIAFISFGRCTLGKNLTNFKKWFPHIGALVLFDSIILNPKCIETSFPYLRFFHCESRNETIQSFDEKTLKKFIKLNSQLKMFGLGQFSIQILQYMSKYLHKLDIFRIPSEDSIDAHHSDIAPIRFKCVKKFEYGFFPLNSLPLNSFAFNQINELQANGVEFNDLRHFLRKHSTITDLSINNERNELTFTVEKMIEATKALPSLSSLNVYHRNGLSIDDAIHFMAEHKHLKKFTFTKDDTFDVQVLENRLGNDWRIVSGQENDSFAYLHRNINKIN